MAKNYFGSGHMTQVGLIVKDIEKSAQVYAELFGMEVPEVAGFLGIEEQTVRSIKHQAIEKLRRHFGVG